MSGLRFLSAGESHGPKLTSIIEGLPAGFKINKEQINFDLKRRQQGFGRGGRMKIEQDQVYFSSGIVDNQTTGAPVTLEIKNLDYKNWRDKNITPMSSPRPGHADFAGAIKYNHDDLRFSLERASARETAMRCAVGSLCKQILTYFEIRVLAYVTQIGSIKASPNNSSHESDFLNFFNISKNNEFSFTDISKLDLIKEEISQAMKAGDTLGGVLETVALGLPPGLGSYVHYDRKLDGIIAQALMSIPAMKAVEIGSAIQNSQLRGTQVHDEFKLEGERIQRYSNRAGGLEGGMTNGMPLVIKTYMKPISTTLNPRRSIDLNTNQESQTVYERSDFCAVQRAAVVTEAMLAFVLLAALMDKIGGDSKKDMLQSYAEINRGRLGELSMKKEPWRFNYDHE